MPLQRSDRRRSLVVLSVSLVVTSFVFGVPAGYTPAIRDALVAVQIAVISSAAWFQGASAVRSEASRRRELAVAGTLLVLPFLLFSLCPGFGPPHFATVPQNRVRYIVLLVDTIAIAGGCIVLKEALGAAGERLFSTLGFAAILLASSLYLVWACFAVEVYSSSDLVGPDPLPPWGKFLAGMSNVLLDFGGILFYVGTAAFARSFERNGWLGRKATRAFVVTSFAAVLCLVIRGIQFPDPTAASTRWYQLPGFFFGIPAVPWMMPCIFGVVLLRRAGDASEEQQSPQPAA